MNSSEPEYTGANRTAWLVGIAGPLADRGFATDTITAVLTVENNARCRPPLEHTELQRLARSAVEYSTFELGHRAAAFQRFSRTSHIHLIDDVEVEGLQPPDWQIQDIMHAGALGLLYGPPGAGKTFLALDFAFSVQTGHDWHGKPVQQAQVVYIAAEGVAGLPSRLRAWKRWHHFSERAGIQFVTCAVNFLDQPQVDAFVSLVQPTRPRFVIIDTLARCMAGGEEDSARDMGMFIASLDRVRSELDTSVLVLHHPTKNGTVERGSGALRGAVDTVIRLRAGSREITLECEKQKDAERFAPIGITLRTIELPDGSTSCVVVRESGSTQSTAEVTPLDVVEQRLLKTIADAPMTGCTTKELLAAARVAERTAFRKLEHLERCGQIAHAHGRAGRYVLTPDGTATANQLPRQCNGRST